MSENESSVMQFYDGELCDDVSATGLEIIEDIRRRCRLAEAGKSDVLTEIRNRPYKNDDTTVTDILDMIRARAAK